MTREKRVFENNGEEEGQPEKKRPALASVIIEALKVDSLQKLCSSLEPLLRRVVSEEVERALAKLGPAKLSGRVSPKQIEAPDGRNLQLHFRSKLCQNLFTGGKVEGGKGSLIHVVLLDANTGRVITSGPESSAKLDIVVLEGDFNKEEDGDWTEEDFETQVVKEREGKRPLLTGDLQVILKDGVGTLGELTFTDNSSWIRSKKFRLGLKVSSGSCDGIRVREAKSDAFTVKDHRGELYKKHYPPALTDEVWRLEKIGKDGSFHKKLNESGIYTVEDLLRLVVRDPQRLRTILGSGMSNKMWEVLLEHAKTCALSRKIYVYYPDASRDIGVAFNSIYELSGLIAYGQFISVDSVSDNQKAYVDAMVKKAYDNWMHVVEYDGNSFLGSVQEQNSLPPRNDFAGSKQSCSTSFDNQLGLPSLPAPTSGPPAMNSGFNTGGYGDNIGTRYPFNSQTMNLGTSFHFNGASLPQQNQLVSIPQQSLPPLNANNLALGLTQPSTSGIPSENSAIMTSFKGYDDFFPEEEIRVRSHEMLGNEEMQNLLRVFSMGRTQDHGHGREDGFPFSSGYTPNASSNYDFGFDEYRTLSSGKAVVGWLKLKAALRWGIFIRKQAAERRARIIELD